MRYIKINKPHKSNWSNRFNRGQAMLLTTIMIGGIFLMATAVAGLLMFYQLQQTTDFGNSTVAIFAADAVLEKAVFEYFNNPAYIYDPAFPNRCYPNACTGPSVNLSNGAVGTSDLIIPPPPPQGPENATTTITATGKDAAQRTVRLLQTIFLITPTRP